MVLVDHLAHEGKPYAQPPARALPGLVSTPKAAEHLVDVFFGDAYAGISHRNARVATRAHKRQTHAAAFGRVAHGVGHEVHHDLRHQVAVAHDQHGRLHFGLETQPHALDEGLLRQDEVGHQPAQVQLLLARLHGAVFQPVQMQQRLDQPPEPARLGRKRAQMLVVGGQHTVLHALDGGLHPHQRGAQLVGHIAYELAFQVAVALN